MTRYLFLLFVLIFAGGGLISAAPVHVAVVSDSPEVSDRVAADLSKDADVAVIERSQVDLLLQEGALNKVMTSAETQTRLGQMLGVDAFIHMRALSDVEWQINVVQAASGETLSSGTAHGGVENLAGSVLGLLKSAHLPGKKEGSHIAVIDFTSPDEKTNADDHFTALRLAAELRTRLGESGLDVLDRLASAQVSNEQALAENGFLKGPVKLAPMLGADFIITGRWISAEKHLKLSILNLSRGKLEAQESFDIPAGDASVISAQVMKWVLEHVAGKAAVEQFAWAPSVDAEALEPFYRGVSLFQQGQVLEAAVEFQKAYSLSDKFEEAYFWEGRCYEVAGFQAMADAMRFYIQRRIWGYGVSKHVSGIPADGLAFLGVVDRDGDTATCQKLEILTTDAISKNSQRVLLPSNLAQFRDEYDVLVGTKNSRGATWDEAPGFMTRQTLSGVLSRTPDGATLQLRIVDTLNSTLVASETVPLGKQSAGWSDSVAKAVGALLSRNSASQAAQAIQPVALPSIEEIKSNIEHNKNVGILQLALKDPAALATNWRSLQKPGYELVKFLDYGLREYLLENIPATHPNRPWLELDRINGFLPIYPEARYFTKNVLDPVRELEKFVKAHPGDAPGAAAEYLLLWETMAHIPPADLEKRFALLVEKLQALPKDHTGPDLSHLAPMAEHFRQLAIIAQNDPQRRLPLPVKDFPDLWVVKVREGGSPHLDTVSRWRANEWRHFDVPPQDAVDEARAAFAFLGRGNNRFQAKPEWYRNDPHSHALVAYMTEALRQMEGDGEFPLLHPFDAQAEKGEYRKMVDYTYGELRREIHNVKNIDQLDQLEGYEIRRLLTELTRPGFRLEVSDQKFSEMHDTLVQDVADVEKRLGQQVPPKPASEWLEWRKISRARSPYSDQKYWCYNQGEMFDKDYLDTRAAASAADSAGTPLLNSEWYQCMHRYVFASLSARARTDYYMAEYPKFLKDYASPDLTSDEMKKTMEYAATLMGGERYAEAEQLIQKVYDAPAGRQGGSRTVMDLHANAAFQLAAFAIHAGRKAEAVHMLREILDTGGGIPTRLVEDGGWHAEHFDTVQTLALRLLSDLRDEMPGAASNGVLQKVMVRQAGYFPGEIPFYFHVPAGFDPGSGRKYRVLILIPSVNSGIADYCRQGNSWVRFSDEHGVFLVVPNYFKFWSNFVRAQEWSGEATLNALAQISKQYPIDTDRLLFHGYGDGAAFAERFAMWKPELCAAISMHSSSFLEWMEAREAGLHPFSDLKHIPFFVTAGEDEGGTDGAVMGAYRETQRFATFAKGDGIPLIWKSLPNVPHLPAPEMEKLAQAFLASIVDEKKASRHFTGDLRTWKFFPVGDKRAAAVPEQYREDLPSREFAELWGSEQKP